MAEKTAKEIGSSRQWTNERHVKFLNYMEASFVQSMFPPLDRYLPDTSESTKDLVKQINFQSSGRMREKNTRILSSQKSTQDQVVPQCSNKESR